MKKRLFRGFGVLMAVVVLAAGVFLYLLLHRTPGSYFDSDGVRIYYTVEGHGEPLILIHGVAATADLNWRRPGVVGKLARDFQVITFDLRGHGLSGKPTDPGQYGLPMVEDITRLMDHLNIKKAHMAGYSLGGFILLKYLTLHPERVQSAALCAAGWKNPDDLSPIPSPYKAPVKPSEARLQSSPPPSEAQTSDKKAKNAFNRIRSWIGDQLVDKTAIKALKKNYVQLAVFQSQLEQNRVPAICFIGNKDGFFYLAEDLKAHMANLDLVKIPGSNHFTTPFYGQFKKGLDDFFKQHQMTAAVQEQTHASVADAVSENATMAALPNRAAGN